MGSGTEGKTGGVTVTPTSTTNYADVSFDPNNTKFVICYMDQSNSKYGTAIVGSASNTSISFGSEGLGKDTSMCKHEIGSWFRRIQSAS